jgi:hypothetical protein
MLLSALHCTIARICIKIVHIVEVLRVRLKQFGGVRCRARVECSAVMMSRNCSHTINKRSRREIAQAACSHCTGTE